MQNPFRNGDHNSPENAKLALPVFPTRHSYQEIVDTLAPSHRCSGVGLCWCCDMPSNLLPNEPLPIDAFFPEGAIYLEGTVYPEGTVNPRDLHPLANTAEMFFTPYTRDQRVREQMFLAAFAPSTPASIDEELESDSECEICEDYADPDKCRTCGFGDGEGQANPLDHMICCSEDDFHGKDNPHWYHYACVGIFLDTNGPPAGDWYCWRCTGRPGSISEDASSDDDDGDDNENDDDDEDGDEPQLIVVLKLRAAGGKTKGPNPAFWKNHATAAWANEVHKAAASGSEKPNDADSGSGERKDATSASEKHDDAILVSDKCNIATLANAKHGDATSASEKHQDGNSGSGKHKGVTLVSEKGKVATSAGGKHEDATSAGGKRRDAASTNSRTTSGQVATAKNPKGANWSQEEKDQVAGLMQELMDSGSIVSKTEERWKVVGDRLQDRYNVTRTPTAVKNYWNREGRQSTGLDERNKKQPDKLITGVQSAADRKALRDKRKRDAENKNKNKEAADDNDNDEEEILPISKRRKHD